MGPIRPKTLTHDSHEMSIFMLHMILYHQRKYDGIWLLAQHVLVTSYSALQVAYEHILGAQEMCAYKDMC